MIVNGNTSLVFKSDKLTIIDRQLKEHKANGIFYSRAIKI